MNVDQTMNSLDVASKIKYLKFIADTGSSSCKTCLQYNGRIFDEVDPDIPQLPIHPNCRCKLVKVNDEAQIKKLNIFFATRDNLKRLQENKMKGFEASRFAEHDKIIATLIADFNANKMKYAGATEEQARGIPDITPEFFKSFLIQETGGAPNAWRKDPGQVNVPGDWSKEKANLGLKEPKQRNEGDLQENIIASLKYLVRKGFGVSGQAAANRPEGYFDGWEMALRRYNVGQGVTEDGRPVAHEHARRIIERAQDTDKYVPIEFKKIR